MMNIETIIKQQVDELTDFDITKLTDSTHIEEIGLESIDFLSIQVAIKRELDVVIDLHTLVEANITTFGELINYLEENYNMLKN